MEVELDSADFYDDLDGKDVSFNVSVEADYIYDQPEIIEDSIPHFVIRTFQILNQ